MSRVPARQTISGLGLSALLLSLAVLLLVLIVYLWMIAIGAWIVPADDWGVGDQGHDVHAFMAALAASLAVLFGYAIFRIAEFVTSRRSTALTKRAAPIAVALIGLIWTASVVAESLQTIWPHSGDGVSIEVASPFLLISLIALFKAIKPGRRSGSD